MKHVTESRNEEKNGSFSATNREYFCGSLWGGKGLIKFASYILNVIPAQSEVAACQIISSVCLIPPLFSMPELMGGGEKGQQLTRKKNKKNLIGLNYISRGLLMKLNSSHEENLCFSSFSGGEKYSKSKDPFHSKGKELSCQGKHRAL